MLKSKNGITLVALVITIIILLILAGISIFSLTDNGLFGKTQEADKKTEIAGIKEEIKLDIYEKQLQNLGTISNDELVSILKEYGTVNYEEDVIKGITTKKGDEILMSEIYTGEITENGETTVETIATDTSYVGYYADLNGDGEPDGIIYADLAVGGEGTYGTDGAYKYEKETEGLKSYKICNENGTGFGTWKNSVISEVEGSGTKDRFYVMALDNITSIECYWYFEALNEGISDYSTVTSSDFGKGKTNTAVMIEKWKAKTYGNQNNCDMWKKVIEERVNDGWFVPSRGEWGAFAKNLNILSNNYEKYGLSYDYWSSSLRDDEVAWSIDFNIAGVNYKDVQSDQHVRLSAIF